MEFYNFVNLVILVFYIHKSYGRCIKGVHCEIYNNNLLLFLFILQENSYGHINYYFLIYVGN